ncbi:glycosyltransferase family 4 protein [Mucilaginibacter glaciei]|uniref:Glycosyltransferase family 4 protein n=1 Tax=Mucilaginibacter glaciei TaxID=2772109 RepID=A0A926S627_9SPHI|nr:glycosyltransferase family 4 protein [Mucilaginibacter glaciei]MBD1393326.1 glycosyltransferase family 4 protein [Mucilaginibacter glaciei]
MRFLIIGQTPPPYGGQTINIEKIVILLKKHDFDFRFVRLDFSAELSETGKLSFIKIWRLLRIFCSICYYLIVYRPKYVYYPVAGPNKVPVIRDIILLLPVRLFQKKLIFHFHAGGLSEIYPKLGSLLKKLYKIAYFAPYHSICMSNYGKRDPQFLQSKAISIIPYGVPDNSVNLQGNAKEVFNVLFVAVCRESKGILDFIKIIRSAKARLPKITGTVMGETGPGKELDLINQAVAEGLITYKGVRVGQAKYEVFRQADAFLFPTFFEAENFPTVNLEAFSFGLPVVSTTWRGVNDQVQNAVNGFIHQVHDIDGMAGSVLKLATDRELYTQLTENARRCYQENYTAALFDQRILDLFNQFK